MMYFQIFLNQQLCSASKGVILECILEHGLVRATDVNLLMLLRHKLKISKRVIYRNLVNNIEMIDIKLYVYNYIVLVSLIY